MRSLVVNIAAQQAARTIASRAPVVVQGLSGITGMLAKLREELAALSGCPEAELVAQAWRVAALPAMRALRDELRALEQQIQSSGKEGGCENRRAT